MKSLTLASGYRVVKYSSTVVGHAALDDVAAVANLVVAFAAPFAVAIGRLRASPDDLSDATLRAVDRAE